MSTINFFQSRKRIFEEKEFEKPKEDEPPAFSFDLRPRIIQMNQDFKLICCVKAHPAPKVLVILVKFMYRLVTIGGKHLYKR